MAGQPKRRIRPVPVAGRTFLEWVPFWENELGARGARPRTIVNQREQLQRLARHFGDVDAAFVTDGQLLAWRDSLVKRGLKATTINTYNLTVSTFYNWLVDEGVISESPMLYVPLLPVVEYAPPAAIDADALRGLAKGAGSRRSGRSAFEATRDPAMLALLQDTGLRASECAGLLAEHVDIGARQAFVHAAIAKGGYERTVMFGFQTARLLNRYAIARESHGFAFLPQLFVGRSGAASYKTVAGVIASAAKEAGVTGARAHLFRHTWAHDLKSNGVELEVLMSLGGWRTTEMPMRYGRAEKTARAIAAYKRMGSPVDRARGTAFTG